MQRFKLYKSEKLCSKIEIDRLYGKGTSVIAYPLRAVYLVVDDDESNLKSSPARFLISIPKKRIRKAVQRVTLRRRVREAYRLNRRELLLPTLEQEGWGVDIAFVYLDTTMAPYDVIQEKVTSLLTRIAQAAAEQQPATEDPQQP